MKSWEQQPGESDTAFAHFLAFLTLGVGRTVIRAYRATHPDSEASVPSGIWREESSKWSWRKRANDFDLSTFAETARETAAVYAESIRHLGAKALAAMSSDRPEMSPRNWDEALSAFSSLQALFPADTIVALVAAAEKQGDAVGAATKAGPELLEEIPEQDFPVYGGDPWNSPLDRMCGQPGETHEKHAKRAGLYPPERHAEPDAPGSTPPPP